MFRLYVLSIGPETWPGNLQPAPSPLIGKQEWFPGDGASAARPVLVDYFITFRGMLDLASHVQRMRGNCGHGQSPNTRINAATLPGVEEAEDLCNDSDCLNASRLHRLLRLCGDLEFLH